MIVATILSGLTPSFLMVALGGLVRKRLAESAWQGLDRLNFEILFPALLFVAASSRPIALADIARIGPAVCLILVTALVLSRFARPFGPDRFLDFAGAWQTAWRFNSALGLVAAQVLVPGSVAQMALAIGIGVPVGNAFAVVALSRGGSLGLLGTLRKIALNPFLLACVAGVLVALSGLRIPGPILAPLEMIAAAAIPIALISIGATMDWRALARLNRFSGVLCGTRLVLVPALTTAVVVLAGIETGLSQVLIVFSALPTASAAHVLAAGFGADRSLAATLVAQSTLLSAATLPVWILAAKTLV